jgi:hypothetical protein
VKDEQQTMRTSGEKTYGIYIWLRESSW